MALAEPQAFQAFLLRLQDAPVTLNFRRQEDDPTLLHYPLPKCHFDTPTDTPSNTSAPKSQSFTIQVKALKVGHVYTVDVDPLTAVSELKTRVTQQCGVDPKYQRLLVKGKPLQDGNLVGDYQLTQDSVVNLLLKPGAPTPTWTPLPSPSNKEEPPASPTATSTPTDNLASKRLSTSVQQTIQSSQFLDNFRQLLESQGITANDQDILVRRLTS
ncbi:hypothetical protein IWQ62_001343 [Dispira parvispora]|uniref:Ubiquitin-like domain-containing protein n=1 Tax=Dispira parvispora TaxID=1520584 RepID=A0A9W8ATS8_9FUNG|nr:hypothetical protein IWQ62_001343 [Dispira parvispora]